MGLKKNILVCPLDWGLGHATRMVPIIQLFLENGANVIIAADNAPLEFLKQRFDGCDFVKLPGFEPSYPKGKGMARKMALQFPEMKLKAKKTHKLLQQIIDEKEIHIVVSDNRYELFSDKVHTIFITHQLNIQSNGFQKLFSPFIRWQINTYLKKHDELWIPDFERAPKLSGKLSQLKKMPVENYLFVGPLSRFSLLNIKPQKKKYDLLVILSGPEPQRTIFEKKLEEQLTGKKLDVVFLLGQPSKQNSITKGNITKIPHLNDQDFANIIMSSEIVVSRPGYSTLMDLVVFGKKAIFVPTPGQTEQEYLAKTLQQQGSYFFQEQDKLNIETAILESSKYQPISMKNNFGVLQERISQLLDTD